MLTENRLHNGKYRDHYYIYGKTFDEMIENMKKELERYRKILCKATFSSISFGQNAWEDIMHEWNNR